MRILQVSLSSWMVPSTAKPLENIFYYDKWTYFVQMDINLFKWEMTS